MGFEQKDYYSLLGDPDKHAELKDEVERMGYDAFRILIHQFEDALKEVEEGGFDEYAAKLDAAARLFPNPRTFSPTWQHIWDELRAKLGWKTYVYDNVPARERDGVWQIVMDNPFTNSEVVCYPSLSFVEAAYLFAYFRSSLEKNEYIRLQKVVTAIELSGNEGK